MLTNLAGVLSSVWTLFKISLATDGILLLIYIAVLLLKNILDVIFDSFE